MALGNYAGRTRVNLNAPEAMGECDRCGFWYPLSRLQKQFQWQGVSLAWTGWLVCQQDCLDTPQEQNKTLILPPDPVPRVNPRPGTNVTPPYFAGFFPPTSPQDQGFSVYELGMSAPINGMYPTTKAGALAGVASVSGITTPTNAVDQALVLPKNLPTQVLPSNNVRSWVLLYNPTSAPFQISLGPTTWGAINNLLIGAGEAYLQAGTPIYQGPIWAVSQIAFQPLWVWDTISGGLGNDGNVLYILYPPAGYPPNATGLAAGAVYLVPNFLPSNEYAIGVVPGITPNPSAAPVIFGTVTAAQLLASGGGNLPLSNPKKGLGQIWNDGGLLVIDL